MTSGDPVTRSWGRVYALDHGRNGLGSECGLSREVLVLIGPGLCLIGSVVVMVVVVGVGVVVVVVVEVELW